MDVRCERCRAQYVFDDDQVTEAGLAVQCSNCGHVFRVKKKALVVTVPVRPGEAAEAHPLVASPATRAGTTPSTPAPETTPIPEKKEWRVRQANGNVFTFKELTTLQKWIVERKVSRDDEISLSGDQWKRLGNIAELATFFQVVEAAERGQVAPAAITPLPMPAVFPPPAQYPPGSHPPPAYPAPAYPPQAGFSAPIPLQGGIPPSGGPVTQVNVSLPPNPTAAWEGQTAQPRATAPEPAWTSEPRTRLDELEEAELRAVKGGGGKWVLLLVLLLAGGAGAVYLWKPELIGMGKPPPPPPPVVEAKKEPPPPPPPPEPPKVETPPPAPEKAPVMVAEPPPEKPAHRKAGPRTAASLIAEAKRLRDRGKAEQALDLYGQAVEIDPDSGDALAGRGWCYLDLSQYAPAEASFQGALEREAGHADALMGLAETYRYQGRKADAVKYYERYLALHPEGDDAVAARNAISQLKE